MIRRARSSLKLVLVVLTVPTSALLLNACDKGDRVATSTSTVAASHGVDGETKLDKDKDNDNSTSSYYDADDEPILRFGNAMRATEAQEASALVRRYYKAAATGQGAKACSLLYQPVAEALPQESEEIGRAARGSTCATVLTKLFRERHSHLNAEWSRLEVAGERAEGAQGWAVLSFGKSRPPGRLRLMRQGTAWRIAELFRTEMP